jgi:hypothetical protein
LRREIPHSPLATCASWGDVRRWLDAAGVRREASDEVLRPLLAAFKQSPAEARYHALLFLFWPYLDQIARHLLPLGKDPNLVDSQVWWALLEVLYRLDLDQRQVRLGQKILNDVQHDVRLYYERERARQGPFPAPAWDAEDDEEDDDREEPGVPDSAFAAADHRHDVARVRAALKDLVRCGRLSREDCLILIGRYLYDRSLKTTAARLHLNYEVTKKRHQRALTQLKKYLDSAVPDRPRETP